MEKTLMSFDWALKSVLRDKANFDVLNGLLSELLKKKVVVKEILESESNKSHKDDRLLPIFFALEDQSLNWSFPLLFSVTSNTVPCHDTKLTSTINVKDIPLTRHLFQTSHHIILNLSGRIYVLKHIRNV